MRPDLVDLAHYAVSKGMRAVISTNGTLITPQKASESKKWDFPTWGSASMEWKTVNDRFRGKKGRF
jgi:MoaA/NifB/PqqE/SkfB family radical SAM enzyme